MSDAATLLTIQFLRWVATGRRTYGDAREAWRSSCPRLTPWEDAIDDGLIAFEPSGERLTDASTITLTSLGQRVLSESSAGRAS